jgi:multidrug efflux system outer membrane protein
MNKALLPVVALLAGCTMGPAYERPALELPAAWTESAPRYAADGKWWQIYEDAQLNGLVEEALARNQDLALAVARVDESRGLAGEVESGLFPSISASGSAARNRVSTRTASFPPGGVIPSEFSDYRATLNVSYELDFFGRIRSSARAARLETEASEAARDAVRLGLAAQVAKAYFALRSLADQVELTRQTVRLRDEAYALQKKRSDAGLIGDFELRQLEAEAAGVRAQLPPLERDYETQQAALAVLLGKSPKDVFESQINIQLKDNERPGPLVVPSGMPSELLLRRPDIVESERHLAAGNARIASARAEIFPSIVLTGALGSESAQLSNLFTGAASLWTLGLAATQPIFQAGRLEARTAQAEARERQLLAQYQKTVQAAFSETRAALAAQRRARESYDAEATRSTALGETARLARLRYQNGIASQLDVIDAERGLLAARSARIESLRAYRAAIADLFRALGG